MRIDRWEGVTSVGSLRMTPEAVTADTPGLGCRNSSEVTPMRITSPSSSRRRPTTRSSFTKVPLRESPSSSITQSDPTRSICAWRRETSESHVSATSQESRRPMLSAGRPGWSGTRR